MSLQNMMILIVALTVVVIVTGFSLFYSRIYKFPSSPEIPAEFGLDNVQTTSLKSADGTRITAWIKPPRDDAPVLLYFMGNFTSMGPSIQRMKPLLDEGVGFAGLVYRGSAGAPGTPSEKAFAADARALYDNLDAIMGATIPASRRVVHGYSLGTGVAVRLASERQVAGLVLEAAYSRFCDYFTDRYMGFPFCYVMYRERYDSLGRIGSIHVPLLMLHGKDDKAIRIARGRSLFDAANEPKNFVVIEGGNHVNLVVMGLIGAELDFLKDIVPGRWGSK